MTRQKNLEHFINGQFYDPTNCSHIQTIDSLKKGRIFLDDKEYARALETHVLCCLDIQISALHIQTALYGIRQNNPHRFGWHWSGGARNPGESPLETALRHLKRDFGIVDYDGCLSYLRRDSWAWTLTQQHDKLGLRGGCHLDSTTLNLDFDLTKSGILSSKSGDFSAVHWVSLQEVAEFQGWKFHPVLRLAAQQTLGRPTRDACHFVDGEAEGSPFEEGRNFLQRLSSGRTTPGQLERILWSKVVSTLGVVVKCQEEIYLVNRSVLSHAPNCWDFLTRDRQCGWPFEWDVRDALRNIGAGNVSQDAMRYLRVDSCVWSQRSFLFLIQEAPWQTDRSHFVVEVDERQKERIHPPGPASKGRWVSVAEICGDSSLSDLVRDVASSI